MLFRFRLSSRKVRMHLVKLKLIEIGDFTNATSIMDRFHYIGMLDMSEEKSNADTGEEMGKSEKHQQDLDNLLLHHERKYEIFTAKNPNSASRCKVEPARSMQLKAIADFYGRREIPYNVDFLISCTIHLLRSLAESCKGVKKCENCSAVSPSLRKFGCSKIFQKQLAGRNRNPVHLSLKVVYIR